MLRDERAGGVVEHGELAEEGVLLEGAPQAAAGQGPRGQLGHALPVEVHVAVVAHAVGDGGEAAALARAVRPDDAEDLARHRPCQERSCSATSAP